MAKRKLSEVFKTVGLPAYTYIKPRHFGEVRADIETAGKHLLIEGPSGIGKTCVVYAVFAELGWVENQDYAYFSCRDPDANRIITNFLHEAMDGNAQYKTLVADDFHMLEERLRAEIGSYLKRLSDTVFAGREPAKLILIGIPAAGTSILSSAHDLGPRLGSYRLRTASDLEIGRLIDEGESELNLLIENREGILTESSGNFWLAQYICNKICASNDIHEQCENTCIIEFNLPDIRARLMAELTNRFMPAAVTFAKGKKWRPGGNKPYLELLTAICRMPDLVLPFDSVLALAPERRRPGLKAVKGRIKEVIFNEARDIDLRKQIAFEGEYFSLEDPLFRYFLTNLNIDDLYNELGVPKERVIQDNAYTYEIGFSFAGEARSLIEFVNARLKTEDSVTFYDFDQQALLLAADLEITLARIYAESCRFYLVFIERHYLEKVWTRFEKDIMTRAGRTQHIIPVVLEKEIVGKMVGISSTIGLVDLSEEWRDFNLAGRLTEEIKDKVNKKLIQPVLEKCSETEQSV